MMVRNPSRGRAVRSAQRLRTAENRSVANRSAWPLSWVVGLPMVGFAIIVAALLLLTQIWMTNPPDAGAYAPEFRLQGIDGQDHVLSELRGAPVVLAFVSVECDLCAGTFSADLSRLNVELASRFTLVTVVFGVGEGAGPLEQYRSATNGSWLYLRGTQSVNQSYGLDQLPTVVVVSPDGIIVARHDGAVPLETLRADVDEALAK